MIAIIDYGVGNLFSLESSLLRIGAQTVVTSDPAVIHSADKLILPGVGAFGDAADKLSATGLASQICEEAGAGKHILGICLGMQLLFDKSFEYGSHAGLGLISGEVADLKAVVPSSLKVPHIGWNALHLCKAEHPLFKYIHEGDFAYFVHSFHAVNCSESIVATTDYGVPVTAAVASGNVYGFQFHPEKSSAVGLALLKAFCEI